MHPDPSRQREWLEFATATLRELVAGHAPVTLAERLCRLAERHAPGRLASIMCLGDDRRLYLFAAPSAPPALAAEIDGVHPGDSAGSCGNVALHGRPVLVDDIASDTRWEDLRAPAQRWSLGSCHSYPVWHDGELIGTFALTAASTGPAAAEELELLEFAATMAGTLLGFERLGRQRSAGAQVLRRARELGGVLDAIGRAAAQATQRSAWLDEVCRMLVELAGLAGACVLEPAQSPALRVLACRGNCAGDSAQRAQGAVGQAMRALVQQALRRGRAVFAQQQAAAAGALPLQVDGSVVAVLGVCDSAGGALDEELRAWLPLVARETARGMEQLLQRERSERERALHAAMLDNALVGMALLQGRTIRAANATLAQMLGHADSRALLGTDVQQLHASPGDFLRLRRQLEASMREAGQARAEACMRRADGELVWWEIAGRRIEQGDAAADSVWSAIDVTQRRQAQDRLRWQARHDALTQLPNRFGLDHFLQRELEQVAQEGSCLALGWLDLDDFAGVNERWGHLVGDAVLRQVAQRLGGVLGPNDLLARIGGDEFVLVLNRLQSPGQLAERLLPFEQAMQQSFGAAASGLRLGMSLGLAMFPHDETTVDGLLRCADAALLSCKMHKAERASWWLRWGEPLRGELPALAGPHAPQPYGPAAAQLLDESQAQGLLLEDALLRGYFDSLHEDPQTAAALDALDDATRQMLREREAAQLRGLLDPRALQPQRAEAARRAGRRHALTGVGPAALTRALFGLHHELAERIGKLPMHSLRRLHLLDVLAQRVSGELHERVLGAGEVTRAYREWATQALADLERFAVWADFVGHAGAALERLPGIVGAALARPLDDGRFVFEYHSAALQPLTDIGAEVGGDGTVARCWMQGCVQTTAVYAKDPAVERWHGPAEHAGVRSSAAIPVLDAHGRPVAVVALFGRNPGQFGANAVGPWLDTVLQIFRQAWTRFEADAQSPPMSSAAMMRSRQLIGAHKVRMLYQPIVELRSSRCFKVEALARLDDGTRLLSPDEFLPACGSVELAQLFSQGLAQVLHDLGEWQREGVRIDASINLPPSVLRQRDLAKVVERALRHHGIEPARLTFELLESEQWIGDSSIDRSVESLKALGTRMAMDDLGAGHSTLLRLRQLQFDLVKIDRGLVRDMPSHPQAVAAIVGGLTELMHRLDLLVVVEGLETPELVRMATELGVDAGQGYAISHPLPPAALVRWLRERRDGAPLCKSQVAL